MRTRLKADTDAATFIIFDPKAIQPDDIDTRNPFDALGALTADGKAVCYSYAADGDADFLVLIGEEPDAEYIARRRSSVEGVLLHVPSGRLVATGYEDLCGFHDPEAFQPSMGDSALVPAGDYLVGAFEVDWGELVEEKISERALPGDETFETVTATSMGCVIAGTVLVLPAILGLVWSSTGFEAALKGAGIALAFHVIFWSIAIPVTAYSKRAARMIAARQEIEAQHPSVVLVLRPLDRSVAPGLFAIGKFGDGFAQ